MKNVKLLEPNKLFFTSDTHFGHKNIMRFSDRPFTSVEDMDREMISKWNETVPEDGIVFFLGDFSFHKQQVSKDILEQLNGKVILIKGNHDKNPSYFKEIHNLLDIKVLDNLNGFSDGFTHITLCHYPMAIWNKKHYGSWHLHGHSHGTYKPVANCSDHHFKGLPENLFFKYNKIIDVGVDVWNFRPVSYNQIANRLGD